MTIQNISIIGAGTMGHGIAQVTAQAGYEVYLYDIEQRFVDRGLAAITTNLDKGIERGKSTPQQKSETLARIRIGTELRDAAVSADLVIEAIPEKLSLKGELYTSLASLAPAHSLYVENQRWLHQQVLFNQLLGPFLHTPFEIHVEREDFLLHLPAFGNVTHDG